MSERSTIPSIDVSERFQRDPLLALLEAVERCGDVVDLRIPAPFLLLNHPDLLKEVLLSGERFPKPPQDERSQMLLGRGIVLSEGEAWRHQRRVLQPAFHQSALAVYSTTIATAVTAMLERWHAHAQQSTPLDVEAEMQRITLTIACQALFGADFAQQSGWLVQTLSALTHARTPLEEFASTLVQLNEFVYHFIAERRRYQGTQQNLLEMLLQAGMDDQHLRDELITLLIAGYDTTASLLTWFWYELAINGASERRLHAELAAVLGGGIPTIHDLPNLPYTRMALDETLRIAPPVWATSRMTTTGENLGGYRIRAGALLLLSPYTTHRHREFWTDPEVFQPERFTPECSAARPRFAFFPFGGGPRQCIGNQLAIVEAQFLVAIVAQHYQLRMLPNHSVEPEPRLSLRIRNGLPMILHRRE